MGESCCASPTGTTEQCSCVADLDGGTAHTCAVKTSGAVWCWGDNAQGQLGDGTNGDKQTPVQVRLNATPTFLTGASQVGTGDLHSCALKSDGTVWCWGRNMSGQLGDMTTMQRLFATQVVNLTGMSSVAVGWDHSCAVKASDGSVWCWGSNSNGQLGNGMMGNGANSTPVQVMNMTGATQVTAGELHTCVRKSDQTAWCWGRNNHGQLGNDTMGDSNVPVQVKYFQGTVKNLTGVTEVVAGQTHSCGRLGNTEVRCWGLGTSGQLGNAMSVDSLRAALVSNLTNPAGLAAGAAHSCATLTTGTEVCWGTNAAGQLGTGGTPATSNVPVAVNTLTRISTIGNGSSHSCAALQTETTQCWGSDSAGQLGNGSGGNQTSPGPVSLTCP